MSQIRQAVSLGTGDRELPLEIDVNADVNRTHEWVGDHVEVSAIAQGAMRDLRGEKAKVLGVYLRFGKPVGLQVLIEGKKKVGSLRDFYLDRCLVEDARPPTATSAALREGLSHWDQQRDYWFTDTGGLEALAFAVASVTPQAIAFAYEWGWDFSVPDPMLTDFTQVRCPAFQSGNFWTVNTAVSPIRGGMQPMVNPIEDHWARTFQWTYTIAKGMVDFGWPWEQAVQKIEARARASALILRPLVLRMLDQCLDARRQITGDAPDVYPRIVSAGFSVIRLKANTIGLTEPPTDRRPYTVISVDPQAAQDFAYLKQVVLHECIHIAVGSSGGEPHNGLFNQIADLVGLEKKHRD